VRALYHDAEMSQVLLVLQLSPVATQDYFVTLCDAEFIPTDIIETLNEQKEKHVSNWHEITIDFTVVTRDNKDLNFVTTDPFKNRTCDNAMVQSLRSGIVAIRAWYIQKRVWVDAPTVFRV
jgi:hypothetical protein